jgi:hypothetical protein
LSNQPASNTDEPKTKLIEIAARLTDMEVGGARDAKLWLRAFRKNFRHIGASSGMHFEYESLGHADQVTDKALETIAKTKAA